MKFCPVVMCIFLAISSSLVLAKKNGPSRNLYRFITLLSGHFNNEDQQSTDNCTCGLDYHENITISWKPVYIESLHGKLTFYFEVAIAGQVSTREIWIVSEDRCGVIHVVPLFVLDCESYNPGDLERVDFNNIKYQSRGNTSGCEILFYSVDENVFVGTIPGCLGAVPGALPVFGITFTCYSVSFHVCNIEFFNKRPILPYINFKKYSYPLLRAMTEGAQFETDCFYPHD